MSAWYVLSSIGLYQVTPGQDFFNTVEPTFKNTIIKLDDKNFVNIPKLVEDGYFINSQLNDWVKGLEHYMWENYHHIVPIIEAESKSFISKQKIILKSYKSSGKIYYSLNKNKRFKEYKSPFVIKKSSIIHAYSETGAYSEFNNNKTKIKSDTISAQFIKKPNNYTINIKSKYNKQYHAGGDEGLIDGVFGTDNWKKGEWQGYQYQDFEAVIDLQTDKEISSVSANFLQDSRSWILMPKYVEFYTSIDNVNFTIIDSPILHSVDPKDNETKTLPFSINNIKTKARYVKIIAKNYGKFPEWHQGFGDSAFIFIDEITIK